MIDEAATWIALGRWDLRTRQDGVEITYANLVTGQIFVCGLAGPGTRLGSVLGFVASEGVAGDLVFLDHELVGYVLPEAMS